MKLKGHTDAATPLLPAEEGAFYTLELEGLPKGKHVELVVTYDDVLDPVKYPVGVVPDGRLVHTFPVLGKGGRARVFAAPAGKDGVVDTGSAELLGSHELG